MYDLFIIGGGINGTGIAADAAGRGLRVILCEQNDLASGTSSASSKSIHGGLRYLEQYQFHLVHKALKEREILWRKAPHLIHPLPFVLPYVPGLRPKWLIRLGLWIYDHLALRNYLPATQSVNLRQSIMGAALKSSLKEGFVYYDCWGDDARLVVANAIAAKEHSAIIKTREKVIHTQRLTSHWIITTENTQTHAQSEYKARIVINASGPWAAICNAQAIPQSPPIHLELVKGSHIIVKRLYTGAHAYLLMNTDKRVIFVMPFLDDYTMIGTTDVRYEGDPHDVHINNTEIDYLCQAINRYFTQQTSSSDIIWSYSGVRPLQANETVNPSEISRDYFLDLNTDLAPLLTIIGGKITTYRELGEHALARLSAFFPHMQPAWTATAALPGGDLPDKDLAKFIAQSQKNYPWLPDSLCERYVRAYGTRMALLLADAHSLEDLGTHFGHGLYQREVDYLIEHEWAMTTDDILWRRSKLGIYFSGSEVEFLAHYLRREKITSPLAGEVEAQLRVRGDQKPWLS